MLRKRTTCCPTQAPSCLWPMTEKTTSRKESSVATSPATMCCLQRRRWVLPTLLHAVVVAAAAAAAAVVVAKRQHVRALHPERRESAAATVACGASISTRQHLPAARVHTAAARRAGEQRRTARSKRICRLQRATGRAATLPLQHHQQHQPHQQQRHHQNEDRRRLHWTNPTASAPLAAARWLRTSSARRCRSRSRGRCLDEESML